MIKFITAIIILLTIVGNVEAATYYVRTADGGTSTECTGLADAAYDGAGSGEACAFEHIFYALGWYGAETSDGTAGVMVGGDTLIIKDESVGGGYTAGFSGCSTGYPYGCITREIPSGSAGNTTKIYGANYASCADDFSNATKVWGRERATHIFNLGGNDYIDLKCLDITDKSSCVYNVRTQSQDGTSTYVCNRSGSYPLGDHADNGIRSITGSATNITLDHVRITGLVRGVFAQKKQDWTVTDSDISFNSSVNWDNDTDGGGSATANHDEGTMVFTRVTMNYAGCGEVWNSRGTPYYCTSQDQSGYGDSYSTGGGNNASTTMTDVEMIHNVSDDLDNLYDDGTGTTLKINRGVFGGSSGQGIKSAAELTYAENFVAIGNCGYFKDKSFTTFANEQSGRSGTGCNNDTICGDTENSTNCQWVDGDADGLIDAGEGDCPAFNNCRAGSILAFANVTTGQKFYIKNATIYSNGDTVMTMSGTNVCSGGTLYDIRNSNVISGIEFNDGVDKADFFYSDGSGNCADGTFTPTEDYNYIVNSKNGSGDATGANSTWSASDVTRFVGTIPLNTSYLTDDDVVPNFYLTSAIGGADETVTCQGDCSLDYQSFSRGAAWDIGAIEYGSTPSGGGGGGGSAGIGISFGGVRINLGGGRITKQ